MPDNAISRTIPMASPMDRFQIPGMSQEQRATKELVDKARASGQEDRSDSLASRKVPVAGHMPQDHSAWLAEFMADAVEADRQIDRIPGDITMKGFPPLPARDKGVIVKIINDFLAEPRRNKLSIKELRKHVDKIYPRAILDQ